MYGHLGLVLVHHAVMAFIFSHTVNVIYVSPGEWQPSQ